MNLKAIGTTLAVTATVAGAIFAASPADAITLTGENTLSLSGRARFNTGTGRLNFREPGAINNGYGTNIGIATVAAGSTGSFESFIGDSAILKDFTLAVDGVNKWKFTGLLSNFIDVNAGAIQVDLFEFALERRAGNDWIATVSGTLNGLDADGIFDPTEDGLFTQNPGSSYTFDIEAVPTPAMIPGLIGMGLAALRKRKDESSTEAEA